jgi:hypothetical protein
MTIYFYTPEEVRQDVTAFEGVYVINKAKEPFGPRLFFELYADYWEAPIDRRHYAGRQKFIDEVHKRSRTHVTRCSLPYFEQKHDNSAFVSIYTLKTVIPFILPHPHFIPDGHKLEFCINFYKAQDYQDFLNSYDGDFITLIHEDDWVQFHIRK